jgi:dTDP-4-dehydrorhamnose 3,5-epimerase-like enzyme
MSTIKKIKTFFSDSRGKIIDIFSKKNFEHCSIVTFKKNSVRGNHFHKKSIQSAYIINGTFKVISVKVNKKFNYNTEDIENINAKIGDYITHYKFEAHTYKCLSKSGRLIVFTLGVRGGAQYEVDTFKLKRKLI